MRVLFARNHTTVYPRKGVFLAGPTPGDGTMLTSWRRTVIAELESRFAIDDENVVVLPEPLDGEWKSILSPNQDRFSKADNDQIGWELQYLQLCDITAFWLPVYWTDQSAGSFPANIGPTTRWEFGMMVERYLSAPFRRKLIVGGPDDAESTGWARHVAKHHGIPWHRLPKKEKHRQVASSFVDAIANALPG
jgi:hypothetical protein